MNYLSQNDPRWKSKRLGSCSDTLGQSGCFITCLAMLSGRNPDEVNDLLKANGGFQGGCLLVSDVAARVLGLPYDSNRSKPIYAPCVAETDHYKGSGVPQHFFVWLGNGLIADPLDGKEKSANTYRIVSYRNFGTNQQQPQGDDVTKEQAVDLIYVASRGHKPEGGERSFAMGFPEDKLEDLARLRFKDDNVATAWIASNGDYCPESEKEFWANSQRENKGHPVETYGRTWFGDHVQTKLDASANKNRKLNDANQALSEKLVLTEGELKNVKGQLDQTNDQSVSLMLENQNLSNKVDGLSKELEQYKNGKELSPFDMLVEAIRRIIGLK